MQVVPRRWFRRGLVAGAALALMATYGAVQMSPAGSPASAAVTASAPSGTSEASTCQPAASSAATATGPLASSRSPRAERVETVMTAAFTSGSHRVDLSAVARDGRRCVGGGGQK